jgi:predicted DNA-binding transcriptional regulator AlpA
MTKKVESPTNRVVRNIPRYMRAREASDYFKISKSTLWNWVKNRMGFPPPLKAGEGVTLFDIPAIETYLRRQLSTQRGLAD